MVCLKFGELFFYPFVGYRVGGAQFLSEFRKGVFLDHPAEVLDAG